MRNINDLRARDLPGLSPPTLKPLQRHCNSVVAKLGKALFAVLSIPDWLRMFLVHNKDMRESKRVQRHAQIAKLHAQLDKDILPWTIGMAFYAISGAVVIEDEYGKDLIIEARGIRYLAELKSTALLPIQRAALQDPSKASGLTKLITCTQALWFCSQCIARLSQNMAISLIELNTFAHCVSAFSIYAFWWHKPYDVESHVYIHETALLEEYFLSAGELGVQKSPKTGDIDRYPGIDIFEPRSDRKGLLTSISWPRRQMRGPSDHQIKDGDTIPGTGFILHLRSDDPHDCSIAGHTLESWKRLWCLRSNTGFRWRRRPDYQEGIERRLFRTGVGNFDEHFELSAFGGTGMMVPLILTIVFLVYGGVHLLAWQYNFQTNAEGIMWRIASTITAASGLIILVPRIAVLLDNLSRSKHSLLARVGTIVSVAYSVLIFLSIGVEIIARSYLVVESFRALPNSPSSVYEIPRWTAYFPHI
jgi:hypothetical protein